MFPRNRAVTFEHISHALVTGRWQRAVFAPSPSVGVQPLIDPSGFSRVHTLPHLRAVVHITLSRSRIQSRAASTSLG